MENYDGSRRYYAGGMQIQPYHGPPRPYDLRSYSASYSQPQIHNPGNFKLKKGKSMSASSSSKPWGLGDPELQRRKRVASYKMYSVEGKVKGSLRRSFRWLKERYTRVVYNWW